MTNDENYINIMDYADIDLDEYYKKEEPRFFNKFKNGVSAWAKDKLFTFKDPDELKGKKVRVHHRGTRVSNKNGYKVKEFFIKLKSFIKELIKDDDLDFLNEPVEHTVNKPVTKEERETAEDISEEEINSIIDSIIAAEPKEKEVKPRINVEPDRSEKEKPKTISEEDINSIIRGDTAAEPKEEVKPRINVEPDRSENVSYPQEYNATLVRRTEDLKNEGYSNKDIAKELQLIGESLEDFKRREALRDKNRAHYEELKSKYHTSLEGYTSKISDEIQKNRESAGSDGSKKTATAEDKTYNQVIQDFMQDLQAINASEEDARKI